MLRTGIRRWAESLFGRGPAQAAMRRGAGATALGVTHAYGSAGDFPSAERDHASQRFLEPPTGCALTDPDYALHHPLLGAFVGGYELLRVIGMGGQGVVFEARQRTLNRSVAIKVVSGASLAFAAERRIFEREVRSLARLRHAGIAAIYDCGQTSEGQAWFAMELIDGQPLSEWVQGHRVSRSERIELFLQICDAVSYAHQHGVIHRDLKPGNILVHKETERRRDGETQGARTIRSTSSLRLSVSSSLGAQAKILDFGLARFTDADGGLRTETGRIQGTIPYISPEQARGDAAGIDVRSDVYCLGVVLFELLTERAPFDWGRLSPQDALREICDAAPLRPGALQRDLPRDLEYIVLHALEKEPARRYQSVAALADDLRRFLDGHAILARPPSAIYQLRKLAARHKAPVVLASCLVLSLAAFAVFTTVQAWQLKAQRDDAFRARQAAVAESLRTDAEAQRSIRIASFLESLFQSLEPRTAERTHVTARDVLDLAAGRVTAEFSDDARTASRLRITLGRSYAALGQYEPADALLRAALADLRQVHRAPHADLLDALRELARLRVWASDLEEARDLLAEAQQMARKLNAGDGAQELALLRERAAVARGAGQFAEAENLLREIIRRVESGSHCPVAQLSQPLSELGEVLMDRGQGEEAEACVRRGMELRREFFGEESMPVAWSYDTLGSILRQQYRYAEARGALLRALDICRRLGPEQRGNIVHLLTSLAWLAGDEGRPADAVGYGAEAVEVAAAFPPDHPHMIYACLAHGAGLAGCGLWQDAGRQLQAACDGARAAFGAEHPQTRDICERAAAMLLGGEPAPTETVRAD